MSAATPSTAAPTRERLVQAAAELMRRRGYAATGIKDVTAVAGAPSGSLYHFFPEGKEALGEEVLRTGGAFFLALYETIADDAPDVAEGVRRFFDGAAETLVATDFADACPVATVGGEVASTHPRLREAVDDVFASWVEAATERFTRAGIARTQATVLARQVVVLIEGGFLLSRVARDTAPLLEARDAALALLALASPRC